MKKSVTYQLFFTSSEFVRQAIVSLGPVCCSTIPRIMLEFPLALLGRALAGAGARPLRPISDARLTRRYSLRDIAQATLARS
jgi:hypothetical protein